MMRHRGSYCDFYRKLSYRLDEQFPSVGERIMVEWSESALRRLDDLPRRPVYAVRGKPVDRETALEILLWSTNFDAVQFRLGNRTPWDVEALLKQRPDRISLYQSLLGYDLDWFPQPEMVCCGWVHPDGYIGINGYYSDKNPFPDELLDYWVLLAAQVTDQLDLVVVFGDGDERWDPKRTMAEQILAGFHLRGREIRLLEGEEARTLFSAYDAQYGDHRKDGPLRDPRPGSTKHFYDFHDADCPLGSPICVKYMLYWQEDGPWGPDLLPPLPHKVDKNCPMYYGIPDYRYETGPITLEEMYRFAKALPPRRNA